MAANMNIIVYLCIRLRRTSLGEFTPCRTLRLCWHEHKPSVRLIGDIHETRREPWRMGVAFVVCAPTKYRNLIYGILFNMPVRHCRYKLISSFLRVGAMLGNVFARISMGAVELTLSAHVFVRLFYDCR